MTAAVDVQAQQFWANPFRAIANSSLLTLYYVFDVVPRGPREGERKRGDVCVYVCVCDFFNFLTLFFFFSGKFQLADVTIAREADFGNNDRMTTVISHLGTILRPGNHCWGFATEGFFCFSFFLV
jgi:hypothetical protein